MDKMQDGGPAFPYEGMDRRRISPTSTETRHVETSGMTLHDYYVGKIMQGFCANPSIFAPNPMSGWSLCNCTDADLIGCARSLATDMLDIKARDHG